MRLIPPKIDRSCLHTNKDFGEFDKQHLLILKSLCVNLKFRLFILEEKSYLEQRKLE